MYVFKLGATRFYDMLAIILKKLGLVIGGPATGPATPFLPLFQNLP